MAFKKGTSGNPTGRPKGSKNTFTIEALKSAINEVEHEDKVNFLKHFIRRSLESDRVLVALINKLIPNADSSTIQSALDEELLKHEIQLVPYDQLTEEKVKSFRRFFI